MRLECRKCGFLFEKAKIPPRCPYCSSSGSVALAKSAQDLLDEVSGEMDIIEDSRKERGI